MLCDVRTISPEASERQNLGHENDSKLAQHSHMHYATHFTTHNALLHGMHLSDNTILDII